MSIRFEHARKVWRALAKHANAKTGPVIYTELREPLAASSEAMAVEPQMQRREEQLAGYVRSSFRVLALGDSASPAIQLVTAAVLYFGAEAVIAGEMSMGELVAFNMLTQRLSPAVAKVKSTARSSAPYQPSKQLSARTGREWSRTWLTGQALMMSAKQAGRRDRAMSLYGNATNQFATPASSPGRSQILENSHSRA